MDPRLQAGLELQLEKQAQQEYASSLSGVLGQYFKQADETLSEKNVTSEQSGLGGPGGLALTSTDALVKAFKAYGKQFGRPPGRHLPAAEDLRKKLDRIPIVAAKGSTKQK